MKTRILPFFLALAILSGDALSASRTITLEIQNMTCPVCPLTVKKALASVDGVQQVSVDYASRTATVAFDDASVTEDTLTEATKAAGYPSIVRQDSR